MAAYHAPGCHIRQWDNNRLLSHSMVNLCKETTENPYSPRVVFLPREIAVKGYFHRTTTVDVCSE